MDKLKSVLSMDDRQEDESDIISQSLDASKLSWSTRIKGFLICFIIGTLMSVFGSISIFFGTGLTMFGLFYTLGNICALSSTMFLMGPVKQCKNMFKEKRLIATLVMLACVILTLMAAFWWQNGGLALLFVVLQFLAMTWYSLSYIPFARDAVKKTCQSCFL